MMRMLMVIMLMLVMMMILVMMLDDVDDNGVLFICLVLILSLSPSRV